MPTILIVGGGFSGVALTHHLTHLPWPDGIRIVVAERGNRIGRGVAYSTDHPAHLLNVPAGRMGALANDEGHFLRWLRALDPSVSGDAFVPRSRYGDYLEHLLQEARQHAASNVTIETLHGDVVSVAPNGTQARARFRSGDELVADRVVLAVGNLPPRDPMIDTPSFFDDERYVRDPWEAGALGRVAGAGSVLLIGSGLTMIDAALALHDANPEARFVAVSRHGLLPLSHRDWPTPPPTIGPSPALDTWNGSASGLLRIVRREAEAALRAGLDWRDVINGLRPLTPVLWRRMPPRERARFFQHVRPFWDTHRHRMSTRVATIVNGLVARGQLSVVAGRIAECARDGDRVAVAVRLRGGMSERHDVEAVVNCTGPESDYARARDALIVDLRTRGVIAPDALGLGADTDDDGALIDARGRASSVLFTLGSPRRPALWESTAVPELRAQADALARRLHTSLRRSAA